MAEYDIILGKTWHLDIQPQIPFKKNLINLQNTHATRHITMRCWYSKNNRQEEERPTIELMSVKQARQPLIKSREYIIGKLESTELQVTAIEIRVDGKQRSEIQELLNKHRSCFPKQLSNKMPPRRTVNHNIDIQPDSKPRLVHLTGSHSPRRRNCRNSWSNCYNRVASNPADLHMVRQSSS